MINRFKGKCGYNPNVLYITPGDFQKLKREASYFIGNRFKNMKIILSNENTCVVYKP